MFFTFNMPAVTQDQITSKTCLYTESIIGISLVDIPATVVAKVMGKNGM